MDKSVEVAKFLADSPHRVSILRAIRAGDRPSRADLAEHVDASRRTIKRTLDRFDERGWILRDGEGLTLTVGGGFALDGFESFATHVDVIDEYHTFVSKVNEEVCRIGPAEFEGATVVETAEGSPFAPVEYLLDRCREATDRAHILVSYISRVILEELLSAAGDQGLDLTIVVDENVRWRIETTDRYRELLEGEGKMASLYTVDESMPLSFALVDERAMVSVPNDEDVPAVLLESANRECVAVIERRLEQICARARPLSV